MDYDIIFVTGEVFFDHPLCGIAILKRFLEKNGFSVGIIELPQRDSDIKELGKPRLFFGVSSGGVDSMIRNYTPLKKLRQAQEEEFTEQGKVPDRADIVYCNWIKKHFKDSVIVLGGTEATLRRFVHYDYWDNKLRKPILFDSRADILAFGNSEKQILEIANQLRDKKNINNIAGTCIISKSVPDNFIEIPSFDQVSESKESFCDMQNLLANNQNLAQKIDNRYVLQFKSPIYSSKDLDEYYGLDFTRKVPKYLRGFEFSVITHRGCVGECNFCSLKLTQGRRVISRSEESIIKEIEAITSLPFFKGNIDDLGGPSANMYGMDCDNKDICKNSCLDCDKLDRTNKRLLSLLKKTRNVTGVKNVFIKSGIRYDLASPEYIKEVAERHIFDTLRIAPEHVNKEVLKLMNKDRGDLNKFIDEFKKHKSERSLSFYFMTAHPGSDWDEAEELACAIKNLPNADFVQVFTPTPMTVSTCMYYTGIDPKTKEKIHVPYAYSEKKVQKRVIFDKKNR